MQISAKTRKRQDSIHPSDGIRRPAPIAFASVGLVLLGLVIALPKLLLPSHVDGRMTAIVVFAGGLTFIAELAGRHSEHSDSFHRFGLYQWTSLATGLLTLAAYWTVLMMSPSVPRWPALVAAGVLLFSGCGLRGLAMHQLGDAFRSDARFDPSAPRMTRGVYAHLHHPSEVGLTLQLMGLCVIGDSVLAAAIILSLSGLLSMIRVGLEERTFPK